MLNFISFFKKIRILILYLLTSKKNCKIISDFKTLQYIKKGFSITRFGDGELVYAFGFPHMWQIQNEDLSNKLKYIFFNKKNNLLICVPDFLYCSQIRRENINTKGWKLPFYCLHILLRNKEVYGSSFIFRPFNKVTKNYYNIEKDLIEYFESKNIIFVGTDTFYRFYIKPIYVYDDLPLVNAFDGNYNQILKTIIEISKKINNVCVLITCGITGTLLAYDLNNFQIQAIDIGSYFKQLKLGSKYK